MRLIFFEMSAGTYTGEMSEFNFLTPQFLVSNRIVLHYFHYRNDHKILIVYTSCFHSGISNLVVEEIAIISEKGTPPQGFSLISKTVDTEQKPWRKRQLCYKLSDRQNTRRAVTDIIVCSRLKKAPEGFTLVG